MKKNKTKIYQALLVVLLVGGMVPAFAATAQDGGTQGGTNDAKKKPEAVKRDPFWPVGYTPKNMQSVAEQGASEGGTEAAANSWSAAMKKVVINGVSSRADNEYYAVINGSIKSVGDTVSVRLGNSVYTWAVDGIEPPGSVQLRRLSVR